MSKLCDDVISVLRGIFPQIKIKTEEYVNYKGQKLFLDIWLPQINLIVEVHGVQHDKYVPHFHGSLEVFKDAKRRDKLKEEWADLEGYTMVVLREHQLPITQDELLFLIEQAQND